jgi:hypothetical protein
MLKTRYFCLRPSLFQDVGVFHFETPRANATCLTSDDTQYSDTRTEEVDDTRYA